MPISVPSVEPRTEVRAFRCREKGKACKQLQLNRGSRSGYNDKRFRCNCLALIVGAFNCTGDSSSPARLWQMPASPRERMEHKESFWMACDSTEQLRAEYGPFQTRNDAEREARRLGFGYLLRY